jgi:tetratricopeptide (TPR) repeat protein
MKNKIFLLIFSLSLLFTTSCIKKLDVTNDTNPSIEDIYSDPQAVYGAASSLFYNWYIDAQTHSWSPQMSMITMADQGTSSWLNSGMYDLSSEPRKAFDNSESYKYAKIFNHYWEKLYAVLNNANDILKLVHNGMEIGKIDNNGKGADTKLVEAVSYFIQGLSLGYLGLVYDKAFVITDQTSNVVTKPVPFSDVIDTAIASLQKAVKICENNTFTVPDNWFNGKTYSNSELEQLAYSYMARFLVYEPRNAQQNEATDWQKVLDFANKGITSDFKIYLDNVNWKNWVYHYTYEQDDWVMVDARIIHLMDPNYPAHLETGSDPGVATSNDARLGTDFVHTTTCPFKPERGYYHYSYYLYHRLKYSFSNPDWFPEFYVNELQLIKAEAYVHLGQLSQAIDIINTSSRITRGKLSPLPYSATKKQILDAIFYERDIELFVAGFADDFFDMRRRDLLQKGTLLNFPIPAKELNVLGMPVYTFGGVANADGINTSNGGWR